MSESPLLAQARRISPPEGQLAIWALGQVGYLIKGGATVVVIDPYLSDAIDAAGYAPPGVLARQVPIVVAPGDLDLVDVLLCTHDHADHTDPQTVGPLLAASPQARVLASYRAAATIGGLGVAPDRVRVPPVDQPLALAKNLSVTAIPAAHYGHEPDAAGNPAYLGFLLRFNGVTLYHSGDTILYPGLIERLVAQPIDLCCLPINGRDWFRERQGLVGNLDYREAADLAATIGARVFLPNHNDLFRGNRINPATLIDYVNSNHPNQRVHLLQAGELYYYAG